MIRIREKALALLRDNLKKLKDPDREDAEMLENWFKRYDKHFKLENILVSVQDDSGKAVSFFDVSLESIESSAILDFQYEIQFDSKISQLGAQRQRYH